MVVLPEGPYQLMPPLSDAEFNLLKTDIAEHGVIVPIVLDDDGNVLDGHNRLAAIAQLEDATAGLRIPYETTVIRGLSEEAKCDYVITLNLKRRHLPDHVRLSLLVSLRTSGRTLADIAAISESSTTTVWRQLQDAEQAGLFKQPEYALGKDGKLRPTHSYPAAYMSFAQLQKEERSDQRAIDRATPPPNFAAIGAAHYIFQGDISEPSSLSAVQPHSLDAIITDPPYPQEYIELMGDLGRFAKYALKPGRPLIAMLGHAYLPQYIELLSESLDWHWIMADVLGGANSTQHVWKAFVGWKPLLVFTNGPAELPYYFLDLVRSPGPDKEFHEWGQDVQTFQLLAYRFTQPGGLICDPFLGGGTTAVAALSMNRKFVGFDNDPVAVNTTLHRLANTDWNNPLLTTPPLVTEDPALVNANEPVPASQ